MEYINLEFFFNLEREGKKSIIDFCTKMGFIANSYECPACLKPMKLVDIKDKSGDGFAWVCRHRYDKITRTIRRGTWFQESRLPLKMMLKLAYLWVKRSTYAWICHELKTTSNTVVHWMAFFRRVCVNAMKKEGVFMGGQNEIVEIDAKSFSNVKNKQGRETWVFGGVERSTKNCFVEIIQSGEEAEIVGILKKYVHPGTTILSDNWQGYNCLESNGYKHQKISGFKDKNNILCLWARIKKIVSNHIANSQFDAYLAEIMWRRLHGGDTQALIIAFFKILSHIFTPQVRDDPTCIARKADKEKEEKKYSTETLFMEANRNGNKKQEESVCSDMQNCKTEFFEEIEVPVFPADVLSAQEVEVPLLSSEDTLSAEEDSEDAESQKKRQKITGSFDT